MAAFHVNRFLNSIVRLSREKMLKPENIAVRISYNQNPFRMQTFDFHELLENSENQHLAMAAEMFHQLGGDRSNWMLVVLRLKEIEFPCIVRLDDGWVQPVETLPLGTEDAEHVYFIDEGGYGLVCEEDDALRAGVCLVREYASEMGKTVWDSAVLCRAIDEVIEKEFDQDSDSNSNE